MSSLVDSDDIVIRDRGVILRYENPGSLRNHQTIQRIQPTDHERAAIANHRAELIHAQQEWQAVRWMVEYLDMSPVAYARFRNALRTIQAALDARPLTATMARLGMDAPEEPCSSIHETDA